MAGYDDQYDMEMVMVEEDDDVSTEQWRRWGRPYWGRPYWGRPYWRRRYYYRPWRPYWGPPYRRW